MPVATTHPAKYSILAVELPGNAPANAGVLLEDPSTDRLWVRLRRDWHLIAPEEAEVLAELEQDVAAKATELGAAKLLDRLEDLLSNTLRVTDRQELVVEDFDRALARLYREHVHAGVLEFVTHLPRYSLAVAAGAFLENQEVESEGWDEAPPDLRLTPEMFVARVVGRSMEPTIPNESLCVFKAGVTGSRQGRSVLVEDRGGTGNDRYTVKRYRSVKHQEPDGTWTHERIRLEPLNPEFDAWELDPQDQRYRIIAEFVRVLD
jgi:phage repressor protein C with HTH and peptisase S24 domain